jgi:thymine-DNA glycosylase
MARRDSSASRKRGGPSTTELYSGPKSAEDDSEKRSSSAGRNDTEYARESDRGYYIPPARIGRKDLEVLTRSKRRRDTKASASSDKVSEESPVKRSRVSDKHGHLPALPDTITPNLLCLFVGLNPGIQTATLGHPYAHPSNRFWRLLHTSGLTPDRRLAPAEFAILPEQYSLGNTNIVSRATKDASGLDGPEQVAGAGVLVEKVRRFRPEVVCLVGKGIWEAVWKWKHRRPMRPREFKYGFQDPVENLGRSDPSPIGPTPYTDDVWAGARVFVASSTSGLAASLSLERKEEIWAELGNWVNARREERRRAESGVKIKAERIS